MRSLKSNFPLWSFLLAGVLLPAVWADQVVLKDGDRITGAIVKKDDKNLTIKTEHIGVIVTPWNQVETVVAQEPLNIVLLDGRTLRGTLSVAGGKAEVATSQGTVNMTSADIAAIRNDVEEKAYQRLQHPGLLQLWSGAGTIGLAGTAGNSRTLSVTTTFNASRSTTTDKTSLYFNAVKASALVNGENADTAQAVRGGVSYNHNIRARAFISVFNDDEYDRFQDLDLRFVVGGGMGIHALKTDRNSVDLLAGIAYSRASFSTPLTRNSAEFFWGDEYALKLTSTTFLTQSYRMFNNLTDTGNYRINFDLALNTKISKWLSWNLSLSDRYLSNPVPGRKTNDFLYTTGVGITFGE